MSTQNPEIAAACWERAATEKEMMSAVLKFEGEVIRNNPRRLADATEAAHAALQAHLDSIASSFAIARRAFP